MTFPTAALLPDMCRETAIECEDIAARTSKREAKAQLLKLAKEWRDLADAIEGYHRERLN